MRAKLDPTKARLILVCGLQGAGKTTVAKKIATSLPALILRTDVIRKQMFEAPQYTELEMQKVYDEMFLRARRLLHKKRTVVLDATFLKELNRHQAKELAEEAGSDFMVVLVQCDDEQAIRKRIRERTDQSDATHDVRLTSRFEPIVGAYVIVNNCGGFEGIDDQLRNYF